MSVFTWTPDFGATKNAKPIVSPIKFGDGYEQRIQSGLNSNPKTWDVRFSVRDQTEADEIDDFLEARGAVEAFEWTPPDSDTAYNFICRAWTRSLDHFNKYTIAAQFEQVFEP